MFPPWLHAQLMLHVCQSALLPTQESLQREKSHHRAIGVLVVGANEPLRSLTAPEKALTCAISLLQAPNST